jgi:hypothetical protein
MVVVYLLWFLIYFNALPFSKFLYIYEVLVATATTRILLRKNSYFIFPGQCF